MLIVVSGIPMFHNCHYNPLGTVSPFSIKKNTFIIEYVTRLPGKPLLQPVGKINQHESCFMRADHNTLKDGVQVISFPLSFRLHPLPANTSVYITGMNFTTTEYIHFYETSSSTTRLSLFDTICRILPSLIPPANRVNGLIPNGKDHSSSKKHPQLFVSEYGIAVI